jgi:hypothetical protein
VRLIAVTNNYRIVRHTIIKSEFQKFRQHGLKIALSLNFHMLIEPPRNILRSICYMTPLIGGWLADHVLGQRRTVILGAALMAVGHFMMAFEPLFLLALFTLILGNGAFKPNISTQVGGLYAPGDPRRDRAYSIFYVGKFRKVRRLKWCLSKSTPDSMVPNTSSEAPKTPLKRLNFSPSSSSTRRSASFRSFRKLMTTTSCFCPYR